MINKKEVAYLTGALLGDGYFTKGYNYPRIGFSSSDLDFIKLIKNIIYKNFGFNLNIIKSNLSDKNINWRDHYKISSRRLYPLLSKFMTNNKEIPAFIKLSNKVIKANFLSGFFDAEGGICISRIKSRNALDRRIYLYQKDLKILKKIKLYLRLFDISSFIQYQKGAYALNVWGLKSFNNFNKNIGFKIKRKQDKLNLALLSYKQRNLKWDSNLYKEVLSFKDKYNARKIREIFIQKNINIPQKTIERWITEATKNDREKRCRQQRCVYRLQTF